MNFLKSANWSEVLHLKGKEANYTFCGEHRHEKFAIIAERELRNGASIYFWSEWKRYPSVAYYFQI